MANSLNTSGLTLNSTTFNSMDITDNNIQSILDVSRWSSLPKWSEVATATTGDINIPDCVVDVTSFNGKYKGSTITSFKTGLLHSCNRVTNMKEMFYNCSSLTSLDVGNFDTSNVGDMMYMFYNCSSLTSLNLSSFNTSRVTSTHQMFHGCSSLTSLNLSSFDTSNVGDMSYMFGRCTSLKSLDLSNFNTSKVTNMGSMFYNCTSLTNLTLGSNWGAGLVNRSVESYRTLDLSTTAITKAVANNILSKLANVTGGTYKPIVKFKSSLGLSSTEIAVGTNKGWDVQIV